MLRKKFVRILFIVLFAVFAFSTAIPAQAHSSATWGKKIYVVLSQQRLYAYYGSTLVKSMPVNARGTARGTFSVLDHYYIAPSIYRGWKLPFWLGIYYVGRVENGIHGPEYLSNGRMAYNSLGCVVILNIANARWLYNWTPNGTPVYIR